MNEKQATVLLLVFGSLAAVFGACFVHAQSRRNGTGIDDTMIEPVENTPSVSSPFNNVAQKNDTTNLDAILQIASRAKQSRCSLLDLLDQKKMISAPPPLPGKKGIGMTLHPENRQRNLELIQMLNVSWNYSWGATRVAEQPNDIEFVPMIWGPWSVLEQLESDIIPEFNAKRIHRFLTFNEPDNVKQSNVVVERVVDTYWPMLESAKIPMSSPGAMRTFGNWSRQFCQHVEEDCLRLEYAQLHYYGGINFATFQQVIKKAYELYDRRPILLTEFAVADWQAKTPEENMVRND
jgi:Glycosyl hydrolase catalytic core